MITKSLCVNNDKNIWFSSNKNHVFLKELPTLLQRKSYVSQQAEDGEHLVITDNLSFVIGALDRVQHHINFFLLEWISAAATKRKLKVHKHIKNSLSTAVFVNRISIYGGNFIVRLTKKKFCILLKRICSLSRERFRFFYNALTHLLNPTGRQLCQ